MERSRTERVLSEWQRVAETAQRPARPPIEDVSAGGVFRTLSLVAALVVAGAVLLVALSVARPPLRPVGGEGSPAPGVVSSGNASPVGSASAPSASPVASPTSAPSASPAPTRRSPAPSRSASPTATTAHPGDARIAVELVQRYEGALVAGDAQLAWSLLADEERLGSFAEFRTERAQMIVRTKGRFVVGKARHDPAELRRWLGILQPSADLSRAQLVQVEWPVVTAYNQFDVFMAAPNRNGEWRLWTLR